MRRLAVAAIVVATGAVLFSLAYLYLPAVGRPSADAVEYSLMIETGGAFSAQCTPGEASWSCYAFAPDGSGGSWYALVLNGRCWTARLTRRMEDEGPPWLPRRARECVRFRDQIRPLDRI